MPIEEKLHRDSRKYYIFMIILGLLGLIVSWLTLIPQSLPLIPGLGVRTTGKVVGYQTLPATDGSYEYTVSIVQFTDTKGLSYTIKARGNLQGSVNLLYLEQKPDYAVVEGNLFDNIFDLLALPCANLICLILIVLGIYMYVVFGKSKAATHGQNRLGMNAPHRETKDHRRGVS